MMSNQFTPAIDIKDTADPPADRETDALLLAHPWLESLEPYYVEWELVWPM
jgi:hypothetical protein